MKNQQAIRLNLLEEVSGGVNIQSVLKSFKSAATSEKGKKIGKGIVIGFVTGYACIAGLSYFGKEFFSGMNITCKGGSTTAIIAKNGQNISGKVWQVLTLGICEPFTLSNNVPYGYRLGMWWIGKKI